MTDFRTSRRWRAIRQTILRRDTFTCQICGSMLRAGRADKTNTILRPSVIDHLIPFEWPGVPADATTNSANLWSVCDQCDGGIIRPIENRHRQANDWQAVRRDKLAYGLIGLDGYRSTPKGRPIDEGKYP